MSCGFTNDATASQGPSSSAAASSPNSSTTCSANTPSRTKPLSALSAPCGSRPIQPGEPERVEPVGPAVGVDRGGDRRRPSASLARRLSWVPGTDQVGVRDVPLAPVVGAVAGGAEPVAHRRHGVGIEPVHRRVGGRLARPSVSVTPCSDGYWPVNSVVRLGDARRRRPRSGGGARGSAGAQALARGELRAAELGERLRLVGRRVPLLVGHHEEHVRTGRHRHAGNVAASALRPRRPPAHGRASRPRHAHRQASVPRAVDGAEHVEGRARCRRVVAASSSRSGRCACPRRVRASPRAIVEPTQSSSPSPSSTTLARKRRRSQSPSVPVDTSDTRVRRRVVERARGTLEHDPVGWSRSKSRGFS